MENLSSASVFDLEYYFDLSPDMLCIAGYDGYFKKINPAVCQILGYSEDELFAEPINSFIHPDDQQVTAAKRAALSRGEPLLNFENRYVTKEGAVVWLSWTSVPIVRDSVVFAIAKNITYRKQLEEYDRIASIMDMIHDDQKKRFKKDRAELSLQQPVNALLENKNKLREEPSPADQVWLGNFENAVRKFVGIFDLNLHLVSDELAVSERQLFRQVNRILGITPNKLVRVIRLQLAWEAIATGKYRTITEIAHLAGYRSRSYFSKLFKEIYGIDAVDLLK